MVSASDDRVPLVERRQQQLGFGVRRTGSGTRRRASRDPLDQRDPMALHRSAPLATMRWSIFRMPVTRFAEVKRWR